MSVHFKMFQNPPSWNAGDGDRSDVWLGRGGALKNKAILKIIFVCGNPTDWAKNLPTQIFFFDTLKNCRLADSELRNSRVQFFFIMKIWNISFISDEKLRKHALFHRLSTLNKWLFFERWKIIKQKQIRFVIKLK